MEKFLKQKQNPNNSEGEKHHALPPKKKQKGRTYDEEYVKLGFHQCPSDVPKPQCLLCFKALSNDAMKPSKIKRHLMSEHPEFCAVFFERKRKEYFQPGLLNWRSAVESGPFKR